MSAIDDGYSHEILAFLVENWESLSPAARLKKISAITSPEISADALPLLEKLLPELDVRDLATALITKGTIHERMDDIPAMEAAYAQCLELLERDGGDWTRSEKSSLLFRRAGYFFAREMVPEGVAIVQEMIDLLRGGGEPCPTVVGNLKVILLSLRMRKLNDIGQTVGFFEKMLVAVVSSEDVYAFEALCDGLAAIMIAYVSIEHFGAALDVYSRYMTHVKQSPHPHSDTTRDNLATIELNRLEALDKLGTDSKSMVAIADALWNEYAERLSSLECRQTAATALGLLGRHHYLRKEYDSGETMSVTL